MLQKWSAIDVSFRCVAIPTGLLIIYAALKMIKIESLGLVRIFSIGIIIPCVVPCCLVEISIEM